MISLSIFVATSVVVALFGVVPLPEYEDLTSHCNRRVQQQPHLAEHEERTCLAGLDH